MDQFYKIIHCNWKHYALLADLGSGTFYETFAEHNSPADMEAYITKTYSLKKIEENLQDPAISYFAAYDSAHDIGYIKLIENVEADGLSGKIMELEKIYVRKEAHGSPVSSLLMQKAIDISRERNFDYLFLGVWQENKRALAFYKKFGFEVFNTRKFKLGNEICDDYLLSLKLH